MSDHSELQSDATVGNIARQLSKWITLNEAKTQELMEKHSDVISRAVSFRSFTSYAIEQIATAEGFVLSDEYWLACDEDDEDDG